MCLMTQIKVFEQLQACALTRLAVATENDRAVAGPGAINGCFKRDMQLSGVCMFVSTDTKMTDV